MLFRNAVMWVLLLEWVLKDVVGCGRVLSAYVGITMLLVLICLFVPVKPESALKAKLLGPFWRRVELLSQFGLLLTMIWFGCFVIGLLWFVTCVCLCLIRLMTIAEKKKAKQEWTARDLEAVKASFSGVGQPFPGKAPA